MTVAPKTDVLVYNADGEQLMKVWFAAVYAAVVWNSGRDAAEAFERKFAETGEARFVGWNEDRTAAAEFIVLTA